MVTAKQQLAELTFPGDLRVFVSEAREVGASWRIIAHMVSTLLPDTLSVSHETIRVYYYSNTR